MEAFPTLAPLVWACYRDADHSCRFPQVSPWAHVRYYARALAWARLLLQGSDLPAVGGQVPPLVLNAPVAFEKFAEVIARAALPDASWHAHFQARWSFLSGQQSQNRKPDIFLSGPGESRAVGDTKYRMCWSARLANGWELPKKPLCASSPAIGTNSTSTCA